MQKRPAAKTGRFCKKAGQAGILEFLFAVFAVSTSSALHGRRLCGESVRSSLAGLTQCSLVGAHRSPGGLRLVKACLHGVGSSTALRSDAGLHLGQVVVAFLRQIGGGCRRSCGGSSRRRCCRSGRGCRSGRCRCSGWSRCRRGRLFLLGAGGQSGSNSHQSKHLLHFAQSPLKKALGYQERRTPLISNAACCIASIKRPRRRPRRTRFPTVPS